MEAMIFLTIAVFFSVYTLRKGYKAEAKRLARTVTRKANGQFAKTKSVYYGDLILAVKKGNKIKFND